MTPNKTHENEVPFRCEGVVDPSTGAVEVREIACDGMPEMEAVLKRRLESLRRWNISVSKFRKLIWSMFLATILAATYGALHNQLSYTVAPEYFTKIKFRQLGIDAETFGGARGGAAWVGVLCTWWTGTLAALILGVVGMIHPEHTMFRRVFRALLLTLGSAVVFGLAGLGIGELLASCVTWVPPEQRALEAPDQVLAAGIMHNASYLGGLLGLLIGIADLRRFATVVCVREETS